MSELVPSLLVVGSPDVGKKWVERFTQEGFRAVLCPMVTIRFSDALDLSENCRGILTTSRYAIEVLHHFYASLAASMTLYVVGEASATFAREKGWTHVINGGGTARQLLETFCASKPNKKDKYVYLSGDTVRLDLAKELGKKGFNVKRFVVYERLFRQDLEDILPQLLSASLPWGVVFLSRDMATYFSRAWTRTDLGKRFEKVYSFCMSSSVAKGVNLSFRRVVLPRRPALNEMVECIHDTWRAQGR